MLENYATSTTRSLELLDHRTSRTRKVLVARLSKIV